MTRTAENTKTARYTSIEDESSDLSGSLNQDHVALTHVTNETALASEQNLTATSEQNRTATNEQNLTEISEQNLTATSSQDQQTLSTNCIADPAEEPNDCACDEQDEDENEKPWLFSTSTWIKISGIAVLLGIICHFITFNQVWQIASIFFSLVGLAAGLVVLAPEVLEAIRKRQISIDILLVIAAIGACVLGEFAEAGAVVFLFCLGEALEQRVLRRNQSSIAHLLDLTPALVHLQQADGTVVDINPESVEYGSTLVIRAGERLALDADVTMGNAHVDESAITGESMPIFKQAGNRLFAGSLCLDGRLECQTTATVSDSSLARIVRLVEQAQASRSPYERFINRFARYYTPAIVIIASLVAVLPPLLTLITPLELGDLTSWVYRALSLLVIACPCALVIATPVAVVSGISRAAYNGVLVKGGAFMELAARVKALAFDKTGTLTEGHPQLEATYPLPAARLLWRERAEQQALAVAAAIERDSNHPLSTAIVKASAELDGQPAASIKVSEQIELAGLGITARVDGMPAAIGSRAFVNTLVDLDEQALTIVNQVESKGATALLLAVDDQAVAIFSVRDTLRAESPALMRQLHQGSTQAITTIMLTGDNLKTAQVIAQEAGVQRVHAGLLPEDKMEYIERLRQEHGTVAFVGDGINDALALAQADIGIAMGAAGSDIALEVADVALMADNIAELPWFFKLARKVMQTVRISVILTLVVKVSVMILAIVGLSQMWMAIAADVGMLLVVLLFGMRLGINRKPAQRA